MRFRFQTTTAGLAGFMIFASALGAQDPKTADSPAGGMETEGKEAVIQRIEAMFRNSSRPIVQTREFKPAPPYISVKTIPPKDKLSPGRAIIVYKLRFVDAKKAQDAIEGMVGESGTVEVSQNQNMIVANIEEGALDAVKMSLLALDQPQPQVLVETQIVEVLLERGEERDVKMKYSRTDATTGHTDSYGVNMTSPGQHTNDTDYGGFNFYPVDTGSKDGNNSNLDLALKWLATSTDAKILASPNIIADLNSEASMKTGEEIPYNEAAVTNTAVTNNFKFKKTGINLRIKPVLINSDTVRLEIQPEINLLVRYETFPQTGSTTTIKVPVVSIRNISTVLTAADGEVIMLGGLYSSERSERLRKTPYLSDLPLIGEFFTGKDFSTYDKQLLFFMKIHILPTPYSVLTDPESNAAAMRELGDALRESKVMFREKEPPKYTADQNLTPSFLEKLGLSDPMKPESEKKKAETAKE